MESFARMVAEGADAGLGEGLELRGLGSGARCGRMELPVLKTTWVNPCMKSSAALGRGERVCSRL